MPPSSSRRSRAALSAAVCAAAIVSLAACDAPAPDSRTPAPSAAIVTVTPADSLESSALAPRPPRAADAPLFTAVPAAESGIDFVSTMELGHRFELINHSPLVAGGVSIADLDGNGRPDLFLAHGPGPNRLYLQTGPLRFEAVPADAGVGGGDAWGLGSAIVDIDADGDLDLFVCNYDGPNQLFLNDGSGRRFTESAAALGLDMVDASLMPSFADYDNDGDLDLFVLTYRSYRPGGRPAEPPVGMRNGIPYVLPQFEKYYSLRQTGPKSWTADTCGRPDRLFRNDGGRFTDVSRQAGITQQGHGLSATWWDFDRDGFVDLYVGNDYTDPDHLYRNRGDGTFVDVIAEHMPYTTWSSMGADCGDLNNDGLLDFMIADMSATTHYKAKVTMGDMGDRRWFLENAWPRQIMRNTLFLNTGTKRFMEVAYLAGLASSDWTWAVKFADLDCDGRLDVFISNGVSRMSTDADVPVTPDMLVGRTEWDIWKDKEPMRERNLAFRNEGDLAFTNVSAEWALDHEGMSYGTAYGDLDGDGDLDLIVVHLDEPVGLYRNDGGSGHRVVFELAGAKGNATAIGAVLSAQTGDGIQVRQVVPSTGYLSSNDPAVHFGLGEQTRIDTLTIRWPRGQMQRVEGLAADRRYRLVEPALAPGATTGAPPAPAAPSPTVFEELAARVGLDFVHREQPYDDYARQPLLPGKLSQLGGGLAWGDADGDGRDDLWVGGAAGQAGALYLASAGGRFRKSEASRALFEADAEHEDMTGLWLDADGDDDLDLFVASGGVECEPESAPLLDRLYLNDGSGTLSRAPVGTLPHLASSSSAAAACDFDADGDLDIFIGARSIPGRYPETPRSRLLRNDGGRFADVTESLAPGLAAVGLVTAALWSDADGDGRADLLVATEWGPVALFANTGSGLEDRTSAAGLGAALGWWSGLAGVDVDRDGDMDYVALNVGLNTKYGTPSEKKPALLFYGDMEGEGRKRLVEAKKGDAGYLPVRGRSCSSAAMPMVAKKFSTYREFAASILPEIYTQQCLDEALERHATHFESGVWVNDGQARFTWRALPRAAQAAPGYGVVAGDFDGNGLTEIHAVQNLFTREPETGLWRGGIGVSLEAHSGGELRLLSPVATGLVVAGDAKGLAVGDLDADGWPDLTVTQNDARMLAFRNRGAGGTRPLAIRLRGPLGNRAGVGARVVVRFAGDATEAWDVTAGSGYLSQSSSTLWVAAQGVEAVEVRWPGGETTRATPSAGVAGLEVRHPRA